MSYCRPQGPSVPYVNNQYYYEDRPNDYQDETEPRLLEFLDDFRELHNRRHELFLKIFPRSRDEFGSTLEGVIDKERSKRKKRVETVQRSLSIGSPHVSYRGVGDGCEETVRLEWFKAKTVDLEEDEVGAGGGLLATKKFKLLMDKE